jgi:hypothetical protein
LMISLSATSLLPLTEFQDESTRHQVPKPIAQLQLKRHTAEMEFNRPARH